MNEYQYQVFVILMTRQDERFRQEARMADGQRKSGELPQVIHQRGRFRQRAADFYRMMLNRAGFARKSGRATQSSNEPAGVQPVGS